MVQKLFHFDIRICYNDLPDIVSSKGFRSGFVLFDRSLTSSVL